MNSKGSTGSKQPRNLPQKKAPSGKHTASRKEGTFSANTSTSVNRVTTHSNATKTTGKGRFAGRTTTAQPPSYPPSASSIPKQLGEPNAGTTNIGEPCSGAVNRSTTLNAEHVESVMLNATRTRYITVSQTMPRNESGRSLRITTTTVENQTIHIPIGSGIGKSSSRVYSSVPSDTFLTALTQNFLLKSLAGAQENSHTTDTFRNILASLTRNTTAVATGPTSVKSKKYEAYSRAENRKDSRETSMGVKPLLQLRTATSTTTTLIKPIEGGPVNITDPSSSFNVLKSTKISATMTQNGGLSKPFMVKNTHKLAAHHHASGQPEAERERSSSRVQTKGKPCREQPLLPPVLNCRYKCDNQEHDQRYEKEKDGTPCHLHMRVKTLIGVCLNGRCQQA
ncbi:uncharacterized protein LOC142803771 [Rhipicephalus microplus]|uniref:uncharacterized protein LOC142803771 n=1 Tax=Rhipicephalus microplus TaxID=6941 RepID=UPI003F6BE7DC